MDPEPAQVDQVRRFNRAVTRRIGALTSSYLGRGRPLGEARLLYEIAAAGPDGADVRALRTRLALDAGYLSRLLAAVGRDGLVAVRRSPHDRRAQVAALTARGRREVAALDTRSDALAASLLAPLSAAQRGRLVTAMTEVERLLAAAAIELRTVDPEHRDAQWCLAQYFAELDHRFDAGFVLAQSGSPAPAERLAPPSGLLLIAYLDGEPVGCGGVKMVDRTTAEVKRMWVAPSVRGMGVGRRLLDALEAYARRRRAATLRLDTNKNLAEAQALYRSAGFEEVAAFNAEPYAHHWFAKSLAQPGRKTGRADVAARAPSAVRRRRVPRTEIRAGRGRRPAGSTS
jgi:DNA-binding MarR family transcriptional regulator/GNAT superfamily N-acetyltransferase